MNVTTDPGRTRRREWSLQERPRQGTGVEPAGTTQAGDGSGACGNGQVIDPGALGMGRPGASGRCWRRNRPRRRRSSAGGPGTRVRSSPTVASTAPIAASVAAAIPSSRPPTVDGSSKTASSSSTVTTSETTIARTRTSRGERTSFGRRGSGTESQTRASLSVPPPVRPGLWAWGGPLRRAVADGGTIPGAGVPLPLVRVRRRTGRRARLALPPTTRAPRPRR